MPAGELLRGGMEVLTMKARKPLAALVFVSLLLLGGCGTVKDLATAYVCDAVLRLAAPPPDAVRHCEQRKPIIQKTVVCDEGTLACRCEGADACARLRRYCHAVDINVGTGCDIRSLETVSQGDWILIH